MKQIFKDIFSMWFELPYKEIFNTLFWSFKLYLLILAPYLAAVFTVVLLSILFGGFTDVISNLPGFTVKYFYDGQILDFVAWRVHLTWFVLCFFICLNEELK